MAERTRITIAAELSKGNLAQHWLIEVGLKLLREKPLGSFGGLLVLGMFLTGIFAGWLAPYGYNETHSFARVQSYSQQFWLGSDDLGRDVLSRCIYGARISMYVGLGGVAVDILLATVIGLLSGFFRGWVDMVGQRFVDAVMCFPGVFLLLTIMALMGPGIPNVILVLGLNQGIRNSRVIRGTVMSARENQYVDAARAIGCRALRILLYHVLPNIMAPILILATVDLGYMILTEATISFLGYGIPPPMPSWGGMLSTTGLHYMVRAPWMALWPGICLTVAVFGFNMLGDGLRDVLDPRLRGASGGFGRR